MKKEILDSFVDMIEGSMLRYGPADPKSPGYGIIGGLNYGQMIRETLADKKFGSISDKDKDAIIRSVIEKIVSASFRAYVKENESKVLTKALAAIMGLTGEDKDDDECYGCDGCDEEDNDNDDHNKQSDSDDDEEEDSMLGDLLRRLNGEKAEKPDDDSRLKITGMKSVPGGTIISCQVKKKIPGNDKPREKEESRSKSRLSIVEDDEFREWLKQRSKKD